MTPLYNLFVGTFIHLSGKSANTDTNGSGKHILEINHGSLWVSTSDGKIRGFDWGVRDENDLRVLMEREKWVVGGGRNEERNGNRDGVTTVKVIRAREERNEFFFPGFIGMSFCHFAIFERSWMVADGGRYTYPCPPVSQ